MKLFSNVCNDSFADFWSFEHSFPYFHLFTCKSQFNCLCSFEREWVPAWGGNRERKTENPKQAPHWQQRARCGAETHEQWDHDLSRSQTLTNWATQAPLCAFLKDNLSSLKFLAYGKISLYFHFYICKLLKPTRINKYS